MRGQFATRGGIRMLFMVAVALVTVVHPLRNRMYVTLILAGICAALIVADAMLEQRWTMIAMAICVLAYEIALFVQEYRSRKKR